MMSGMIDSLLADWIDRLLNIPGSALIISIIYWCYRPVIFCLILPLLLVIFLYLTVVCVHVYHLRYWLSNHIHRLWSFNHPTLSINFHTLGFMLKRLIAVLWDAHGRIFNGYEIVGMEKLPIRGPAIIIYYHGTCPLDAYYFMSRHCIERNR